MSQVPHVMIIDENGIFRQELQAMLTPAKVVVVAACGYGVEAVSLAEETKPNLILAAVEEPYARSVQTIAAVRATLPNAPVIAYSRDADDLAVVRQVMRAGARDILSAPFKANDVLSAIELAMKGLPTRQAADASASAPAMAPPSAGTVLTVFGAKGGIGKTTITTNIAVAIAKNTDKSVLIIDLDTRFGDVAIMMDIEPAMTVAQIAPNVDNLDRETFKAALSQHSSGVFVLPSPKHPNDWRAVEPDDVRKLVRFATRMFDYVILDTPGAFNDIVGVAIDVATQVVVVTSVDMASIKDTSFILDLLEKEGFPEERLVLTVNHPNGANTIRSEHIERVLRKKVFWEIPHDNQMTLATQVGQPVVLSKPRSRAATNLTALALKITGTATPTERPSRSLLRRLIPIGSNN